MKLNNLSSMKNPSLEKYFGKFRANIIGIDNWALDQYNREKESSDPLNTNKIRYQYSNHLGSASLELNSSGNVISYEEYFPYGGTSFIAGVSQKEVKLKEYRYTGKERDEFTGLYYYGARYYAEWIGRWMSCDPSGPADSFNLFCFCQSNPIRFKDQFGRDSKPDKNEQDKIQAEIDSLQAELDKLNSETNTTDSQKSDGNWIFTREDYNRLIKSGGKLQFSEKSKELPEALRNNLLNTLNTLLGETKQEPGTNEVSIMDFYHGHIVVPKQYSDPFSIEQFNTITNVQGAGVVYHTYELSSPRKTELEPIDPLRNYLTLFSTNKPESYNPPPLTKDEAEKKYNKMMQNYIEWNIRPGKLVTETDFKNKKGKLVKRPDDYWSVIVNPASTYTYNYYMVSQFSFLIDKTGTIFLSLNSGNDPFNNLVGLSRKQLMELYEVNNK
jgi:RHS repeat-associated protein